MIVLDANVISLVIDRTNREHTDFKHILDWINRRNSGARIVFGGTKYKQELRRMIYCHKAIEEFQRARKCVEINTELIDDRAKQLKHECADVAFNDEHIVAILDVSGCKLVGTKDEEAISYIKRRDFYSDKKVPKVYSSAANKDLLTRKNIVRLKHTC